MSPPPKVVLIVVGLVVVLLMTDASHSAAISFLLNSKGWQGLLARTNILPPKSITNTSK